MEPIIYKPSIYKGEGGIYKGEGGIYKGIGVYNDGAGGGGGNIIYYNTFKNFNVTSYTPDIGPTITYSTSGSKPITELVEDGLKVYGQGGYIYFHLDLFQIGKRYKLTTATKINDDRGDIYGSFTFLNGLYFNAAGQSPVGAAVAVYGRQIDNITFGDNFRESISWGENTVFGYGGHAISYNPPELVLGKIYKVEIIADFIENKVTAYMNDEFMFEYTLSASDMELFITQHVVNHMLGGGGCYYTRVYEKIEEL